MRGRKPTPTKLKILAGTRRARINRNEPSPAPIRPEIPEHLDALARGEWERLCPILERMGVLTEAEGAALTIYCECYSKWLRARGDVAKRGLLIEATKTTTSKRGATVETVSQIKANPAVAIEIQMARLMKEILIEFGLTPSARSRIKTNDPGPRDRLGEFLARQKAR
jgi:P27 family predicted phage terminase small subunit